MVPTALPPFPGVVFEAHHPIAHNGLSMLALDPAYLDSLPKPALCAVFLAAMHKLKKVELQGSALLINTAMQAALSKKQLLTALDFINSAILRTRRGYPPIKLSASLSEDTFNDYFNACVTLENWNPEPTDSPSVDIRSPAFLSSTSQSKALDKTCYEAWLEVAPFLPKDTVAKAQPFIKSLASTPGDGLINRLVSRVIEYTEAEAYFKTNNGHLIGESPLEKTLESNREYAAALAAYEFRAAVTANRVTAQGLGLHRSLFDEAPLDLTKDYDLPKEEANPYKALEALDTLSYSGHPDQLPPVKKPEGSSFLERAKARLAAKGVAK